MKAIYSYKILDRFWKKRTEDFFKLAKVSVEYSKKLYPTVLYTDNYSKSVFDKNGVIFDEYVVDDSLFKDVNEHTYGLSKFVIFENENNPYISLDLDTILFQKIYSDKSIVYGYKEIDFKESFYDSLKLESPNDQQKQFHMDYTEKYYWKYFMLMDEEFSKRKLLHYTDTYPSNSLIVVNNPSLMRECSLMVRELVNKSYRKFTVQFYEQYLLYALLRNYKASIGFLHKKTPIIDLKEEYRLPQLLRYKFLHLDTYDRSPEVMDLVNTLNDRLVCFEK